jgi:hypothetical protein
MKNPMEVLRTKEQELARVKEEVAALRITARLLGGENTAQDDDEDESNSRRVVEMP